MKSCLYIKLRRWAMAAILCCNPAMTLDVFAQHTTAGVAGQIISVGSDTMADIMALWSQDFNRVYPHIKFQLQAAGSSTAPPALTEGTANIGAMSRELKISEINQFVRKHGYPPLALKVAVDAIAVFVEWDNPLPGLTIGQIDSIFSVTRFCGETKPIRYWQELMPDNALRQLSIVAFGRNSVSGTYGEFKLRALCDGDFHNQVREQPGSASVVQSIASTPGAIGYAAFGYKTAGVRAVPVANAAGQMIEVNRQTVVSGRYPLTRYLYLVVNKPADRPLPVLEREFLRYVLSEKGQGFVEQDGYFPLPEKLRARQLALVGG